MHPGKHRIVLGAEPVHEQDTGGQFPLVRGLGLRTAGQPHQADIGGVVDELQLGAGRRGRRHNRDPVQAVEAKGLGKFHGQLEPERRHRMTGPEIVASQSVVPGHVQGAGHVGLPGCPAFHSRW